MSQVLKPVRRLLIANRGEIAVRVSRTARDLGIESVAIHPADDLNCLHVAHADRIVQLDGTGARAYLDRDQIIEIAKREECDAIHPGYGFLSENATFAGQCEEAGLLFIGPRADTLFLLGDKIQARQAAADAEIPVLPATTGALTLDKAVKFYRSLRGTPMIIKAVGGGGGRGMRVIRSEEEIEDALARCQREAEAAFGIGALYAEKLVQHAAHIEVQIVADNHGGVSHLGERDCSIQRRHQKLVETAPSPQIPKALRTRIHNAATHLAQSVGYNNLGTFEFLVEGPKITAKSNFYFIEANPRLQVEHTVTEEVTGVDLVHAQIELARGATLKEIGLEKPVPPDGYAIQLRVNMETMQPDGSARPSVGTISLFEMPSGPGVRVDTFAYSGYKTSSHYDSLLAKIILHGRRGEFGDVVHRASRSLTELRIEGVKSNTDFLANLLDQPDILKGKLYTGFIEDHLEVLTTPRAEFKRIPKGAVAPTPSRTVGAKVDAVDPLAVISYGHDQRKAVQEQQHSSQIEGPEGSKPIIAYMQSTIVSLSVKEGDHVHEGQELLLLNAMKMEHVIRAECSGIVRQITVEVGDTVPEGTPLVFIEEAEVDVTQADEDEHLDLDTPRPDLAEVIRRRDLTADENRGARIERRHAAGGRTARDNIYDLCDDGTFMHYGSLAVGSGLQGDIDELLGYAPSDGLVMGLGHVNGDKFAADRSRVVALAYDYTVLAGTQGGMNHKMMDRMFQTADKLNAPVVIFTEGGGGRAGGGSRQGGPPRGMERQITGGGGLNTPSWNLLSKLSGRVPVVGVNAGFCFAGNAVLLGCCDIIIATENSSIGIGGPAMIEGGGLGVYRPEEVGPMSVQVPNGVVDIAVKDEAEAVVMARKYLSYFQGPLDEWESGDQRVLRHAVPENRLRVYDVRKVIETIADTDSVLELRPHFGLAMITSLIRIEGKAMGVVANNPAFISGAIDTDAADKAARFLTMCDAFDIPVLLLCDCPGIMVGPEVEKTALVRHSARMFVVGASITVPTYLVILRKAYGLGAQAMAGGCHKLPVFVVAWPTSEFGGMGLEGQVKLGQRAALEAVEDAAERQKLYERMVEAAYNRGKGLNAAHVYEIDDVIDPADTRKWLIAGLRAAPPPERTGLRKRPCIDTW